MQVTIDLTYAKNALFIRQSVAVAFGISIDREFTWEFFRDRLSASPALAILENILCRGLPRASLVEPDECLRLQDLLRLLKKTRGIQVWIELHD